MGELRVNVIFGFFRQNLLGPTRFDSRGSLLNWPLP